MKGYIKNASKNQLSLTIQQGFSLIEVMIASLILSTGLLVYVHSQWMAFHISQHAYLLSLADLKNNELAERFRSCRTDLHCRQMELALWQREIKKKFPEGDATVVKKNLNYESKIYWVLPNFHHRRFLKLLFLS